MRSAIQVDESTEISLDDARNFTHFLRVQAGPARLDLSLSTASALHDLLNAYFGAPDPVAACSMAEEEPRSLRDFDRMRAELRAIEAEAA